MEFFRIKKDIPFMKHALVFNAISFITFALAVFFLLTRGLVNLWYGGKKKLKSISIGQVWKPAEGDGHRSVANRSSNN